MKLLVAAFVLLVCSGFTGAKFGGNPGSIPNLLIGWDPTTGVSTDTNGITSVTGAWGSAITATGTGTTEPDSAANGPTGQSMFQFTVARTEFFSFAAQTLTAFTACVAADVADTSQRVLFSRSSGNTYLQINDASNRLEMRSTTGTGQVNIPLPSSPVSGSFQFYCVSYDSATNTATPWLDCEKGTSVVDANFANKTFITDQFGKGGSGGYSGYVGDIMLWSRVANDSEIQQLCTRSAAFWKPDKLYVATTGSDSSLTPWLTSTPWLTPMTAIGKTFPKQTLCFNDTDTFRPGTTRIQITPTGSLARAGTATKRIVVDGSCRQLGVADIRYSSAPTLVDQGSGVYTAGTQTADPAADCGDGSHTNCGYVFYVPGGTPTFDARNLYSTNVVRTTHTAGTQTAPGCNEWGRSVGGAMYVKVCSAGTPLVLATGDIEVSTPTDLGAGVNMTAPFYVNQPYWNFNNLNLRFAEDRGFEIESVAYVNVANLSVDFNQSDGIDFFERSPATPGSVHDNYFYKINARWNGRVLSGGTGGNTGFGDGISGHDTSSWSMSYSVLANNDKSGNNSLSGTVSTYDQIIAIGTQPVSFSDSGDLASTGGSMTVRNSLLINTCADPVACTQNGIWNKSGKTGAEAPGSPGTMTAYFNTIYTTHAAGACIYQTANGGGAAIPDNTVVAKNNICSGGFLFGLSSVNGATLTADHNLYNVVTSYVGASAGAGDVVGDPLLRGAPYSLIPDVGSPSTAAGVTIGGITVNFLGAVRSSPPNIGGY